MTSKLSKKPRSLQSLCLSLIWSLYLFSSTLAYASPGTMNASSPENNSEQLLDLNAVQLKERLMKLDQVYQILQSIRDAIDRSQFDFEALLDSLNHDPEQISEYVRSQIAFQSYSGSLRGAFGTLLARSGNSLDQSLLAARLLKDAGYEARIKRATISELDARTLLQEMFKHGKAEQEIGDKARILSAAKKLAKINQLPEDLVDSLLTPSDLNSLELFQESHADAEALLKKLASTGDSLVPRDVSTELIKETRDYFWVEHRLASSKPWQILHPAISSKNFSPKLESSVTTYKDKIPAELSHRFTFQVFAEIKKGNNTSTTALTSPYGGPVPNLIGSPISYMNAPSNIDMDTTLEQVEEALGKADSFFPLIGNALAPGAMAFDLSGNIVPPDVMSSMMAGIVKTVGDKASTAASAISSLGSADSDDAANPPASLESQKFVMTLRAPDGTEEVFERVVYRRGESPIAPGELLARQWNFMLDHGGWPDAYILDQSLAQTISTRPLFEIFLRKLAIPGEEVAMSPKEIKKFSGLWTAHPALFETFQRGAEKFQPLSYRHKPMLLGFSRSLPGSAQALAAVDIVTNPRRSLSRDGKNFYLDTPAVLKSGVWETAAEHFIFQYPNKTRNSAHLNLQMARRNETPTSILKTPQKLNSLTQLSAPAIRNLKNNLEQGYLTLVPESKPESLAWWRVNPHTGETVGVLPDGTGGDAPEYAIILKILSLLNFVIFGGVALNNCIMKQGSAKGCCFLNATAYGATGALVGSLVARWAAASVTIAAIEKPAHAFIFMETFYRPAATAGILSGALPSFCNYIDG